MARYIAGRWLENGLSWDAPTLPTWGGGGGSRRVAYDRGVHRRGLTEGAAENFPTFPKFRRRPIKNVHSRVDHEQNGLNEI